jgi:hypothetical protein
MLNAMLIIFYIKIFFFHSISYIPIFNPQFFYFFIEVFFMQWKFVKGVKETAYNLLALISNF